MNGFRRLHLFFASYPFGWFCPTFCFSFVSLGILMNGFVGLPPFLLVFGWFCSSSWPLPSSSLVVVLSFNNLVPVSSSNLLPNNSRPPSFTLFPGFPCLLSFPDGSAPSSVSHLVSDERFRWSPSVPSSGSLLTRLLSPRSLTIPSSFR